MEMAHSFFTEKSRFHSSKITLRQIIYWFVSYPWNPLKAMRSNAAFPYPVTCIFLQPWPSWQHHSLPSSRAALTACIGSWLVCSYSQIWFPLGARSAFIVATTIPFAIICLSYQSKGIFTSSGHYWCPILGLDFPVFQFHFRDISLFSKLENLV